MTTKSLLTDEDRRELIKRQAVEIERLRTDYSILKADYDALREELADVRAIAENAEALRRNLEDVSCRQQNEVERLRTTIGYLADNIDNPALVAVAEAALKPPFDKGSGP